MAAPVTLENYQRAEREMTQRQASARATRKVVLAGQRLLN